MSISPNPKTELIEEKLFPSSYHSSKFKFEQGGMLVYDYKSAVHQSSETALFEAIPILSNQKKQLEIPSQLHIENFSEEELELYEKIKQMPPCPHFASNYILYIPNDNVTLKFNSKFESGNLSKAVKFSDYEYQLTIRSDINSCGNNHWYYFSVFNPRKTSVKFSIVNMRKDDLLYRLGMKPKVFSEKQKKASGLEWHSDCSSITYKQTPMSSYFTLSFTYNFKFEEDLVYFAYSIPYTYTDLDQYLSVINYKFRGIARVNTLCHSLAGNPCEIVTITDKIATYLSYEEETSEYRISFAARKLQRLKKSKKNFVQRSDDHKHKKGVVLTARVHSGETVSSFMMRGAIDFLLSDSKKAQKLRKNYVFKIVPMLNPDGVRYGNYRCSLLGVDLNRRWDNPDKFLHPTVYHTKKMVQVFNERHKVQMFCDMHGHTRKQNVFIYGCSQQSNDYLVKRDNLCAKIIPVLMEENPFFSFADCHFRMEHSKMSTARIVMSQELNIPYCYTMEASFFGPKPEKTFENFNCNDLHMNEQDYETLGASLTQLLTIFLNEKSFYKKLRYVNDYLHKLVEKKISENKTEIKGNDFSNEKNEEKMDQIWEDILLENNDASEDSGGSDSSPEERNNFFNDKRSKSVVKSKKLGNLKPELEKKSLKVHKPKKLEQEMNSDKYRPRLANNKLLIVTKKEEGKRLEEMRDINKGNYSPIGTSNLSPNLAALERRNSRFLVSLQKEKIKRSFERVSDLPKIRKEQLKIEFKNRINFSPRNVTNIYSSLPKPIHSFSNFLTQKEKPEL